VQQLVLVDRLGQFLSIGVLEIVRVAKLSSFVAVRAASVLLPTIQESDRLLLKDLGH
jgi:hypothetical protein